LATLAQDIFSVTIDCEAFTTAEPRSVRNPASGLTLLEFTRPKSIYIPKSKVAA